jgi:hypothetical protein
MWRIALALLIITASTVTANSQANDDSVHRCRGLWTGNSCVGDWQRVDRWDTYDRGDMYIRNGHVQQREPER